MRYRLGLTQERRAGPTVMMYGGKPCESGDRYEMSYSKWQINCTDFGPVQFGTLEQGEHSIMDILFDVRWTSSRQRGVKIFSQSPLTSALKIME